jgi:hypothetical protein
MGGFVIMIGDFYQALLIWDLWIFKLKIGGINIFWTNFWHENIKCYELKTSYVTKWFRIH